MAMDYAKCAKEIFDTVGGRSNLVSAAHCATRLRLVTVDNSKIDMKKLENIDGVKGVFSNNGQLQLIIGTGTVNKVYDEFLKVSGMTAATKEEVKAAAAAKQPVFKRMIKALGDVFVPILPAIVASGLMMGLVEALGKAMPAFAGSDWYGILDLFANTAFTFLPILIAVSAARVFGGNIFLGAVIGMIMIHPNLINAWSVASMDAADIPVWHLFGFSIRQVGYQGHVIPVIIAVWIMCKLENWLHKHVPEMIDLFVTPLCTVLITGFLTIGLIGPVFSTAETYVLEFASWIITVGHGIGAMIMGAIYPLTVVCGIHHMYNVIEAGMLASDGLNIWMPIASAANFAQGAACLAVGLKARNYKTKSISIPSALSAALGITEPAIFGVNLRFFKPFIAGCIGGGCGALYASLVHLGAKGTGVTGIFGILLCLNQPLQYLIEMVIAVGVAFAISFVIYKDAEPKAVTADVTETTGTTETVENIEIADNNKAEETLTSPVNGTQISLSEVADETFASEMLGTTVAVEPADGKIVAPCDGEVSNIFETGHAVCITTESGGELLIHIGIDTVKMDGKGFTKKVSDGDKVHAGDILVEANLEEIKNAGYQTTTMMILTNTDEFGNVTKAEPAEVKTTSKVMTLTK